MPKYFFSLAALTILSAITLPQISVAGSTDDRLTRLETIVANQNQQLAQINALQTQIQELRGNLEVLSNETTQLKQQQITYFTDLDQRLQDQEKQLSALPKSKNSAAKNNHSSKELGPVASPSKPMASSDKITTIAPTASAITPAPLPSTTTAAQTDAEAYQQAFNLVKARQYTEALNEFKAFLVVYPNSNYVPNTHYWLGELYLVQKQNALAKEEFTILLNQYPQHPKIPDAMLKIGLIEYDQGDSKTAINTLMRVVNLYPGTTAANLAQAKLNSIKK